MRSYARRVRLLGLDFGNKRVGLAVSDASGTLARPLRTISRTSSLDNLIRVLVDEIRDLQTDTDGLGGVVIGLPRHLDGSASEQTARVRAFADRLRSEIDLPLTFQERLSSREAEARLALRERDWRLRKKSIDAAAAAVILQDHLDQVNSCGTFNDL